MLDLLPENTQEKIKTAHTEAAINPATLESSTELETRIRQLICVTKPYYALQHLQQLENGVLQAEVLVENNDSGEATLVSGAETGRHLAILGSCALALENPLSIRHFYLATKATIVRNDATASIFRSEKQDKIRLIAQAKVTRLDLGSKTGMAEMNFFTEAGILVYNIQVSYTVLKAELFRKLFQKNLRPGTVFTGETPYTRNVAISNLQLGGPAISGSLGVIQPSQCVGHFDDYPALPVAMMSSAFARMAGIHLQQLLQNDRLAYSVKHAALNASRLAFAGEEINIRSVFEGEKAGAYLFRVTAHNPQGVEFGSIEITLDLI
jgi:hypothetical protein